MAGGFTMEAGSIRRPTADTMPGAAGRPIAAASMEIPPVGTAMAAINRMRADLYCRCRQC